MIRTTLSLSLAVASGLTLLTVPLAQARPGEERVQVLRDTQEGAVLPLRKIESMVLPTMPGMQYLGPEYDPAAQAYRLKFIRNGRVVFVDVDARSGQILSRH